MDMKRMVRLMESAYVSMPVVIGYLKPVILIPAGLWTAIPADQLEAALLHELAHIRRKDFLVYLFQKVIEAVWFFNPFVYWISAVLRQEREYCCDDMALAHIRDRKILVQALISFKEATLRKKMHALAFSGKDSPLLKRVARIAGQSGSYSGRGFWTRAVVIAMICLIPLLTLVDKAGRSFAGLFTPISVSMKARPGIPVIKKRAGHAPAGQPIGPGNTFALHRHHFPDKIPASQVLRKINSSRTLRLAKPPAKFPLPADDIPLSSPEESYGRSEQAESPALDSSMNLPPAIYRPAKGGIRKIAHVRGPYYTAVTIDNRIPSELKESFTGRKDGLRYMVLRINKRITGFYIDDQPVPEENLSKYQGVIKDMLGELIHDSIYFAAISS
jgi:hypothetical protein